MIDNEVCNDCELFKCPHCNELVFIKEIYTDTDLERFLCKKDNSIILNHTEWNGIHEGYYCSKCNKQICEHEEELNNIMGIIL